MKKTLFITAIFLLLPFSVFGAVIYERSPAGYTITNPVNFDVSFDDWNETGLDIDCGVEQPCSYWGIFVEGLTGENTISSCFASTTKSVSVSIPLAIGTYDKVAFSGSFDLENCEDIGLTGNNLEWIEDGVPIFEVVEESHLFVLPEDSISKSTAHITDLLNDAGGFIWLFIGIPLAFVVINKLAKILPKSSRK